MVLLKDGKMTVEDYMKLSKRRLAELLVERDNQPNVSYVPWWLGQSKVCPYTGLECSRILQDCYNCQHFRGNTFYYTTTDHTEFKENKEDKEDK